MLEKVQVTKQRYFNSKLYKKECFCCGSENNLNLHHKTYENIQNEPIRNLVCLCRECHIAVHDILKYIKQNKIKSSDITLQNCHIKLSNEYIDIFGVEEAKKKVIDRLKPLDK